MKNLTSIQKTNFLLYDKLVTNFWVGYTVVSIIAVFALDESKTFKINGFIVCLFTGLVFSLIMLLSAKLRKMITYQHPYVICVADIVWISVGVGLSGGLLSDFYLIYFLVIVFHALVYSLRSTMLVGILCSVAYLTTIILTDKLVNYNVIVRAAFFIAFAYFSGYLCKTIAEYQIKLATKDSLTSLHNRQYFCSELKHKLTEKKEIESATLVFFDVDNFKEINDKKGHSAGDNILVVLSKITEQNLRRSDLAARYGGDEFVIMLPGADKLGAKTVVGRIQSDFNKYFSGKVTISAGYASYPDEAKDVDDLVKIADEDMYKTKTEKKQNKTK